MAIVKMNRISVLGLSEDRSDVIEALMKVGAVELTVDDEKSETETNDQASPNEFNIDEVSPDKAVLANQTAELEHNMHRLQAAIENLDRLYPRKTGMFADKRNVSAEDFLDAGKREAEIIKRLDDYESLCLKEAEINSRIAAVANTQEILRPWLSLGIDLSVSGTERTTLFLGNSVSSAALLNFEEEIRDEAPETHVEILSENKNGVLCAVITLKEHAGFIRSKLQSADFHEFPMQGHKGTPSQIYAKNNSQLEQLNAELVKIRAELKKIAGRINDFEILHDFLLVRRDKFKTLSTLSGTKSTFYLSGWIPGKIADRVVKMLQERFILAVENRPALPDEEYPILLKNNKFNESYELIVTMFGAPHTKEIDPTPVMAPFYFFFFGVMLSDVGYGAVLTLACALLIFKFKVKGELYKMSRMLMISGVASTIWGFFFGGFFGDMVTVLSSGKASFPVLWFDPMKDPMKLMIWSMVFGVIHLFAGMGANIYIMAKTGRIKDAFMDIVPWYFIIIGLGLMLAGFAGQAGAALAIAGSAVLVLFGGRDAKNPIARLLKGVLSLYNITGYFSDILSYTRILALVLATSVIAIVVNMLGFLMGPSILGIIFFTFVGILGHSLNLALSALSAYVHTGRLQYIEFFGKFFEGGGQYWNPLILNTRYVNILYQSEIPLQGS